MHLSLEIKILCSLTVGWRVGRSGRVGRGGLKWQSTWRRGREAAPQGRRETGHNMSKTNDRVVRNWSLLINQRFIWSTTLTYIYIYSDNATNNN